MKQIRIGLFETNSSSMHSLGLMKLSMYESWKRGESVVRFDIDEDDDIEIGDPETEFLHTWGNFFLCKYNIDSIPAQEQTETNIRLIEDFMKEVEDSEWIHEHWLTIEKDLEEYRNTKILSSTILKHSPVALYMTQNEYTEFLNYDDCQSPFIYFFGDTVVIGIYGG